MDRVTPFVISAFTNPSGEIVFRVAGWLNGKRVRKNLATCAEAEAERQVPEVQRSQGETGIRTTVTRLGEEQMHEAEAVFRVPPTASTDLKPIFFHRFETHGSSCGFS